MDHAVKGVPAGLLLGAAVFAAATVLPTAAPYAATPTQSGGLFAPDLACGPAETLVVTSDLLARIRADATPARRGAGIARSSKGHSPAKIARRNTPSQSARKAPSDEQEPRAAALRSFHTCSAATPPNLIEGTGWRLVGPLRHS